MFTAVFLLRQKTRLQTF